jgi:hypothetical protein
MEKEKLKNFNLISVINREENKETNPINIKSKNLLYFFDIIFDSTIIFYLFNNN